MATANVNPSSETTGNHKGSAGAQTELHGQLLRQLDKLARSLHDAQREHDPATAVHSLRKALRRTRATFDLVREALPRSLWRTNRDRVRDARRALGEARDQAVIPVIADRLGQVESVRAACDALTELANRHAPAPDDLRRTIDEIVTAASDAIGQVREALAGDLHLDTLLQGLARSYREARSARKDAKRDRKAFHSWRRRSKELAYQLDLLRDVGGLQVEMFYEQVDSTTDVLGPVVDLIMARDFIRSHRDELDRDGARALLDVIDASLEPSMVETRRGARDVFSRKPRGFIKHVRGALERDLAQAGADGR